MVKLPRDNNGNSYMFFTIVVLASSPLMILLDQQVNTLATHIVFTIYAILQLILLPGVNILSFFWRSWVAQRIELSVTVPMGFGRPLTDVPWRVWRLIDCFLSWNFAAGNVLLCFWIWDDAPDKDTYFLFCDHHSGCQNIWGAWVWCYTNALQIWTAATTDLHVRGLLATNLIAFLTSVSWWILVFVILSVLGERVEQLITQLARLLFAYMRARDKLLFENLNIDSKEIERIIDEGLEDEQEPVELRRLLLQRPRYATTAQQSMEPLEIRI